MLGVAGRDRVDSSGVGMQALKLPRRRCLWANDIGLDAQVLTFPVVITLLTAALFGLAPALKGWKAALSIAGRMGRRTWVEPVY